MKRTLTSISDSDFQEIYSWLLYFQKNFDNAEQAVSDSLEGIATAYMEEQKRLYNRDLTMDEAVAILKTPPHNKRNAGRHARITGEQRQAMKDAVKAGTPLQEVADAYGVSLSYVRQVRNGRIQ